MPGRLEHHNRPTVAAEQDVFESGLQMRPLPTAGGLRPDDRGVADDILGFEGFSLGRRAILSCALRRARRTAWNHLTIETSEKQHCHPPSPSRFPPRLFLVGTFLSFESSSSLRCGRDSA
jgi:hypothetical protein